MNSKYIIQYGRANGNKTNKYCKLKLKVDNYKNYEVYECEQVLDLDIEDLQKQNKDLKNENDKNIDLANDWRDYGEKKKEELEDLTKKYTNLEKESNDNNKSANDWKEYSDSLEQKLNTMEEKLNELKKNISNHIKKINLISTTDGPKTQKLDKYINDYNQLGGFNKTINYFIKDVIKKIKNNNNIYNKKLLINYMKNNNITNKDINSDINLLFNNFLKQNGGFNIDNYMNEINTSIDVLHSLYNKKINDNNKVTKDIIQKLNEKKLIIENDLKEQKKIVDKYKVDLNKLKDKAKGELEFNQSNISSLSEAKKIIGTIYDVTVNNKDFDNIGNININDTKLKKLYDGIKKILGNCITQPLIQKIEKNKKNINNILKPFNKLSDIFNRQNLNLEYLTFDVPEIFKSDNKFDIKKKILDKRNELNNELNSLASILSDLIGKPSIPKNECSNIENKISKNIIIDKNINSYLINKYEDLIGSVRVYVRINDFSIRLKEGNNIYSLGRSFYTEKKNIIAKNPCVGDFDYDPSNKNKLINKNDGSRIFKDFYGVYENITNKQLFYGKENDTSGNSPAIGDAIMQCKDGYSIVVFGYGYSGAGKSYTLINGPNNMLSSALDRIYDENGSAEIYKISELYGYFQPKGDTATGKIKYENIEKEYQKFNNQKISNTGNLTPKKLIQFIESIRINKLNTIKATTNNKVSSRSHLFITIKTKFNNKEGYLTLVDMAGIENPQEIAFSIVPFIDPEHIFMGKSVIESYFNKDKSYKNFLQKITREIKDIKVQNIIKKLKTYREKNGELKEDFNNLIENLKKDHYIYLNYNELISIYEKFKYVYISNNKNINKEFEKIIDEIINQISNDKKIKNLKKIKEQITDKDKMHKLIFYIQLKGFIDDVNKNSWVIDKKFLKKKIDYDDEDIKFINFEDFNMLIKESIYINESINHLSAYFKLKKFNNISISNDDILYKKLRGQGLAINKYVTSSSFSIDNKYYLPNKYIYEPNLNDDKVGMMKKLYELENLGGNNNNKPSKFIMLALIRPEIDSKFCSGAKATLNFASRIKST
jgi:hypothetical protein